MEKYLGPVKYEVKSDYLTMQSGLVNALAYTSYGGLVMPVEATLYEGNGNLKITGMVGQTMDESINVALSYIKSKKDYFKVNDYYFDKKDLHIHFLEGAIKKDGPSAGIAVVTSLLSLVLNKEVSKDIAMTGEITLRGDVLKVGGLREKIIGAYNQGIKKIFIPYENTCDLDDLPLEVKNKIKIMLVKNYKEVFSCIFK